MVFGIGPAGTGKTYLAVAQAVAMLQAGKVDRIVLSRPAVEAGERLGFLPGDLKEKVDPYLRPLYDALHDMMPGEQVVRRMGTGEIEVAPLAFMRGRTLAHAFVILDEAQNTTPVQMKMFLTRMGEGTRMVVTGDLSQIDLPPGTRSGLRDALDTLEGVAGIAVCRLDQARRGAPPAGGAHRRCLRPARRRRARHPRRPPQPRRAAGAEVAAASRMDPAGSRVPAAAGIPVIVDEPAWRRAVRNGRRRWPRAPPAAAGSAATRAAGLGRRGEAAECAPSRPQQADQRADLRPGRARACPARSCWRSARCGARRPGRASGRRIIWRIWWCMARCICGATTTTAPARRGGWRWRRRGILRRLGVPNPWKRT